MTVISDRTRDVSRAAIQKGIIFKPKVSRDGFDGDSIVVAERVKITPSATGLFTTPDLEPGWCEVTIGREKREIYIPDSGVTIRLWPLWDAALEQPESEIGFVRNAGNVFRIQDMTEDDYSALVSVDPNTFYLIFPS